MDLKTYIFLKGFSQVDVANELGICKAMLSKIVNKKISCRKEIAEMIHKWSKGAVEVDSFPPGKKVFSKCPTCDRVILKRIKKFKDIKLK